MIAPLHQSPLRPGRTLYRSHIEDFDMALSVTLTYAPLSAIVSQGQNICVLLEIDVLAYTSSVDVPSMRVCAFLLKSSIVAP
jgi:hypothetical protein